MEALKFLAFLVPVLVIAAVLGAGWWVYMKARYKTAKSNEALIIAGPKLGNPDKETNIFTDAEGRSMKIIRGGGHLLRMHQTHTPVPLTSFQLKLTTPRVYTSGGVPIVADAVAMVKVADTLRGIAIYAEQFLGKKQTEIEDEISEVLNANLRAILSKLTVEEINEDREKFNADVQAIAQKQLDEMGFKITSLGLTDLRDADKNNGYLENLGRPRIAQVRQEAETAEAESDKITRIKRAESDKEAKEQEYQREMEIAETKKEKDLKQAQILEETERARAKSEQSYDLEKTILSKRVQEETLKVLAHKKEEELRISQMEVERKVKLEEESNKIRKAKADADYYETTRSAEALAKKDEIDGATRTKIKREEGLAEAEVILERGKAEAESKRLLAEAQAENKDLVIAEKVLEMLPKYAKEIAAPYANIESIKIIDSGNGSGINTLNDSLAHSMVAMHEPLKELTGIDIPEMLSNMTKRGNTHTVVRKDIVEDIVKEEPTVEEVDAVVESK